MSCVESKKQPSPDRASDGIELPVCKKVVDIGESLFDAGSFLEDDIRVSRGEVPANERKVVIARNRLDGWIAGILRPRSQAVTDVARQVSSSGARHRLAVSNVWRHLHAHFDRVLEECKEMHDGYGRGALLIRVHHLTQAARSVIVDWVTAGELREACLQTYWRAMMYNDQTEFVVAFCFADPADSRRKMWVSELMTKPKSDKWMEKNPEPAKLTRGEERRLCVCKDAVFCSAVCSVTSHECDVLRRSRANLDKCIKSAHALYHSGGGVPPLRCPHEWKDLFENITLNRMVTIKCSIMEETEVTGLDLPTLKGRSLRVTRSFADRGGYKALRVDVLVPSTYDSRLVRAHPTRNLVEVMLEAYPERNRIHISWFSVLAKEFPGDASKEEIATFRGVGRKLLCYGMSLLAPMMKDRRTAIVELEAAGAQCPDESVYNGWSKAKIYYLLRKYENTYASLKDAFAKNDMAKLRRVACLVRDNEDLVRYYNQYGLKATGHDNGDFVDMEGRLTDVLASCESVRVGRVTKAQREDWLAAAGPARGRLRFFVHASEFEREDVDSLRKWIWECDAVEVPSVSSRRDHSWLLRAELTLFDAAAAHLDVTHFALVGETTVPCLSPPDFLSACENLYGKSVFESSFALPTTVYANELLSRSASSLSTQFCLLAADHYRAIRPRLETTLVEHESESDADNCVCLDEFVFVTLVDHVFGDEGWDHVPSVRVEWDDEDWIRRNLGGACRRAAWNVRAGETPGMFAIRDVIDSLCLRHALERGGVLPTSHKTIA
eukprot:jgi/Mesvir1/9511/Mv08937-RA.1